MSLSSKCLGLLPIVLFALMPAPASPQGKPGKSRQEGSTAEHYRRWLEEDVLYIITPEEEEVFAKLTTDEERDAFVEQFWRRRDPDPGTAANEFKEEHYRRIAHANEHFHSGKPGWKTDRGEIYIKFGPPDGRETWAGGSSYARRMSEGGGSTVVVPFERWRYNYIEGIGPNIEVEFVDPSGSGEFRIALSPQEKDALLNVAGSGGNTEAEDLGLETRWMRITRDFGLGIQARSALYAIHPDDFPFERLTRIGRLQKAPALRFRDLRSEVTTRIGYGTLPIRAETSWFRLAGDRFLVPITVEIESGDVGRRRTEGGYQAAVQVYGSITDPSRRTWHEFDHELSLASATGDRNAEASRPVLFQKLATLPAGRYKVEITAKDTVSGRLGLIERSLHLAPQAMNSLALSPVVLADLVQREEESERFEQFSLAGLKVVPNVPRVFSPSDVLNVYLQAYNVRMDPSTREPALQARYFLMKDQRLLVAFPDVTGRSIRYASPQRVVLTTAFRLTDLAPGAYRVVVRITDAISGQESMAEAPFEIR